MQLVMAQRVINIVGVSNIKSTLADAKAVDNFIHRDGE
jgi:hypothetical protein